MSISDPLSSPPTAASASVTSTIAARPSRMPRLAGRGFPTIASLAYCRPRALETSVADRRSSSDLGRDAGRVSRANVLLAPIPRARHHVRRDPAAERRVHRDDGLVAGRARLVTKGSAGAVCEEGCAFALVQLGRSGRRVTCLVEAVG